MRANGGRFLALTAVAALLGAGCAAHGRRPSFAAAVGSTVSGPPSGGGPGASGRHSGAGIGTDAATATVDEVGSHDGAAARDAPSAFIVPGSYTYALNGTVESPLVGKQPTGPTVTLHVDPPIGGDQRQILTRPEFRAEEVLRFERDGVHLADFRLDTATVGKEFRADRAVLLLPAAATVGKTWSWTMRSTDGATTLQGNLRVLRGDTVSIQGTPEPVVVVDAVLVASGGVTLRTEQILWGSPSYKLPLRQDETTDGSYGPMTFHSQSTAVLTSLHPV